MKIAIKTCLFTKGYVNVDSSQIRVVFKVKVVGERFDIKWVDF